MVNVYFLGIGGIGMSALARFFRAQGYAVAGYDRTETALTQALQAEGIAVNYEETKKAIPNDFLISTDTLVVWTPAVPKDLPQYQYFMNNGFQIMKRAEVLGLITRQMRGLCVAGTHGKTTTSTILAHLLYQSHVGCNAFLGGISNNYNTNLLLSQEPRIKNQDSHTVETLLNSVSTEKQREDIVVIEADEFDRSFHQLSPYMSVITSVDPDHLDIYGTEEAYLESFAHYTSLISGALILKKGLNLTPRLQKDVKLYTYAVNEEADFYADNIVIENGQIHFDFHTPSGMIPQMQLGVPIYINIENSVAAMAVAYLNGVTPDELRTGLASYAGIYRRFNMYSISPVGETGEGLLIDDYAHHPSEIRASIQSVRLLYPDKCLTGVFQPHLYTRTRDFADDFAAALSALDEVILLPIYPARELPIEGVNSEMLLNKITCPKKRIISKETVAATLQQEQHDIILTIGAGDISQVAEQLRK